MKAGMVALHYPRREHRDEIVLRVRQAADVTIATRPAASRRAAGSARTARPS
jgi:hypothetical protein